MADAKILTITNHAGGVGKTTTALNLGYHLALHGQRVLLVDLDPQADLTERLVDAPATPTLTAVVLGQAKAPVPLTCDWGEGAHLDLLGADFSEMTGLELAIEHKLERERLLTQALAPLRGAYDYILIDCPPNLLLLTVNALYAADSVLIPVQAQAKAYRALGKVLETIQTIQTYRLGKPAIAGFLLTMMERTTAAQEVADALRRQFPDLLFAPAIPRRTSVTLDGQYGAPIHVYDKSSPAAAAYDDLAREILAHDHATAIP